MNTACCKINVYQVRSRAPNTLLTGYVGFAQDPTSLHNYNRLKSSEMDAESNILLAVMDVVCVLPTSFSYNCRCSWHLTYLTERGSDTPCSLPSLYWFTITVSCIPLEECLMDWLFLLVLTFSDEVCLFSTQPLPWQTTFFFPGEFRLEIQAQLGVWVIPGYSLLCTVNFYCKQYEWVNTLVFILYIWNLCLLALYPVWTVDVSGPISSSKHLPTYPSRGQIDLGWLWLHF